jgi:hypothetical protein
MFSDVKSKIKIEENVALSIELHHNHQSQVSIEEEIDVFEDITHKRPTYDLSSFDVMKEDKVDYFCTQQSNVDEFEKTKIIYDNPTYIRSILLPMVDSDKSILICYHSC